MAKKQPEALRLAEWIEEDMTCQGDAEIAAELRRLHALNAELLEALKWAMNRIEIKARHEAIEGDKKLYAFAAAMGAIAKAEEQA